MLALHFEHPAQEDTLTVGPAPYFRIEGTSLRAGPDDVEVGHYQGGAWHVDGKTFLTATADTPARVRFEIEGRPCTQTHGPFERLRLVDGAIRHGPAANALLAKYNEASGAWYIYPDQKGCHVAVLSVA